MKNYKVYHLFVLFLSSFIWIGFGYGYQGEGFSQYKYSSGSVSFSCFNQCFIILGQKDEVDYLNIEGKLNGNGSVGYGFLRGDQKVFLNQTDVDMLLQVEKFIDLKQHISSIQGNDDLIFLVNGNINGTLDIKTGRYSFFQKFIQGWKDFCVMETMQQYSINLHYGISVNGYNIINIGYILFIIISIFILMLPKLKKQQKCKIIFYLGLGIFLLIGVRNSISYTYILDQGLSEFTKERTFYDIGDYIGFIEKVRGKLDLDSGKFTKDNCKIFINEYQHRAIQQHAPLYLSPCEIILTGDMANYIVYYKTEIAKEDLNKKVLVNFSGSYLLDNNLR